jgi:hypothetical protein
MIIVQRNRQTHKRHKKANQLGGQEHRPLAELGPILKIPIVFGFISSHREIEIAQ